MKRIPLLLITLAVLATSCERHEFEGENGTKQLHTHGHDDDHQEEDAH
jgi:hypothetical protein